MNWPLASDTWGPEERDAVARVLYSGNRTMGSEVRAFEEEFAEYTGAKYAVMVNSGSSANLLAVFAMKALGMITTDDVVTAPALAWSTTYSPYIQAGICLKIIDVDLSTFLPRRSEFAGNEHMVVVHTLGNPDEIRGKNILEDCCEAMGARYSDMKHVGTRGVAGTFSLFFSHQMTTGEGGVVITDNDDLWRAMVSIRAHGWDRDWLGSDQSKWNFIYPGLNVRPMEFQGAVGRVQLRRLDDMLIARSDNYLNVKDIVDDFDWIDVQHAPASRSGNMAIGLVVEPSKVNVNLLRKTLTEPYGIATRPLLSGNIARQPMSSYIGHLDPNDYPYADCLHHNAFLIGNAGTIIPDKHLGELRKALERMEKSL